MKDIVVIGAGKIGSTIARLLAHSGDYKITVADRSAEQLTAIDPHEAVSAVVVDITDRAALESLLRGKFAALSAAPYHLTVAIAEAAAATGIHYLDLTEDVESTRRVKQIAADALIAGLCSSPAARRGTATDRHVQR